MPPSHDTTPDAYAAILTAVTARSGARGGDLDIREHLRVTTWILEEMTDTFTMLAFANACDECDDAGTPHPGKPGPGGNFADYPEPGEGVRAEAQAAAVRLYARILAAPGGYDPAPSLVEWCKVNEPPRYWCAKYGDARPVVGEYRYTEAAARCWGHYAVMSAIGHGVCWEDDNAPLTGEDGTELPRPGYPLRVYAEDITWSDEATDAARAAAIDADRALDARNEAKREAHERKARERGE